MPEGRTARRPRVGFIFPNILDKYENDVWRGVCARCAERDVDLVCFSVGFLVEGRDPTYRKRDIIELIDPGMFDGFIFLTAFFSAVVPIGGLAATFKGILSSKPCVSVGAELPGASGLCIDNGGAMGAIVDHLVEAHGYRRVGFIRGPSTNPEFEDRFRAYRDSLARHGIPFDPALVMEGDFSSWRLTRGDRLTARAASAFEGLDAVACLNDNSAVELIGKLGEAGFGVPGDIAVTGFDDSSLLRGFSPGITTARQRPVELGCRAVDLLLDSIAGAEVPGRTLLPLELVLRESCGCGRGAPVPHAGERGREAAAAAFLAALGAEGGLPRGADGLARAVADAALAGDGGAALLGALEGAIGPAPAAGEEGACWTDAVDALFDALGEGPGEGTRRAARKLAEKLQARRIYREEEQLRLRYFAHYYISIALGSAFSPGGVRRALLDLLPRVGAPSAHFFLFEPGSKREARVFAGFRPGGPDRGPGPAFNARSLAPPGVGLFEERSSYFAMSLYHKDRTLGYALIGISHGNGDLYENVPTQVATAIMSTRLLERGKSQARELASQVAARARELEEANGRLKELDRLKNEFIANIAHDFRSPLSVILNAAELAMLDGCADPAESEATFAMVSKSAMRLKGSIDRLLELARLESGKLRIRVERLDPLPFVEAIAAYYRSAVSASGISVTTRLPAAPVEDFWIDREKLEDILDNLISNAVKFVDPGRGRIAVELADEGGSVLLAVADDGVGIPPAKLAVIFDRFERGREEDVTRKGTGIGLAYAKQLAERMGGTLWAESEGEGSGARFCLRFPKGQGRFSSADFALAVRRDRGGARALIEAQLRELPGDGELRASVPLPDDGNWNDHRRGLVLVVEDDSELRGVLGGFLRASGFPNQVLASDGERALEALRRFRPDCVVSDFNMPRVRGDELLARFRADPAGAGVPFAFLSAVADDDLVLEMRGRGAAAFLKKPVERKLLALTVDELLRARFDAMRAARLSMEDADTGLLGRGAVLRQLDRELAARAYRDLALLRFSLPPGEDRAEAARAAAEAIAAETRARDSAGALGEGEFLVVLPETPLAGARRIASALRGSVGGRYGAAGLREDAVRIERELGVESLEALYAARPPDLPGADLADALKRRVARALLAVAEEGLRDGAEKRS